MSWNYSNTSSATTLTGAINTIVTSMVVGTVSGLPVSFPYTLVLDRDQVTREVVNVTAAVGTTLTITRGQDGTSASSHSAGATVTHDLVARDAAEPQAHIVATTNVHGVGGGAAVVGTTTAQTLTNKTVDGGANTITNVNTSALVGTIPATTITGNFVKVPVVPGSTIPAVSVTDASASRTAHLVDITNSSSGKSFVVGDDGVVTVDDTDLVVDTRRAPGAGATVARIYSKNAAKPALVLDRPGADTANLLELRANAVTIGTIDKDAKVSTRSVTANQIAADTTTKLFEAKDSSPASVFSVNYQGNVIAAGTLSVTGVAGLHSDATVDGNTTLTGTVTVGTELITGAWASWAPTLTNLTLGNGTVTAKYKLVGKTLHFLFRFVLGTTSSVGTDPNFTLPFTMGANYAVADILACATLGDAGVVTRLGAIDYSTSTKARFVYISAGSVTSVTATVPHTWGVSDILACSGVVETA